ncbi:MAG: hypothetical protein LBU35_00060 [Holosporales bacterium]|jgi:protein-L-isoaspartate O-methyltransferase|nr:hypothetical protein [Holosporales bacterium]
MLRNLGQRIIKAEKEDMVFLQLEMNGITDSVVLNAFRETDREDFVPQQFRRMAYQDTETRMTGNARIMLRPYIMAKILEFVRKFDFKNALIIGDMTGYTSAIFSYIFDHITIVSISNHEAERFPQNIKNVKKIELADAIFNKRQSSFDFIFFDSGFYKLSTIKKSFDILFDNGMIIYLAKIPSFDFSLSKFNFTTVNINNITSLGTKTIFTKNIYMPEEFVL